MVHFLVEMGYYNANCMLVSSFSLYIIVENLLAQKSVSGKHTPFARLCLYTKSEIEYKYLC